MSAWEESLSAHRDEQTGRILHSARALIAEAGVTALNMTTIAAGAGVSRQTLYKYFPDVESVLAAIIEHTMSAGEADLASRVAEHDDPSEKLAVLVWAATSVDPESPHHMGIDLAALSPRLHEQIEDHRVRSTRLVAEILRAGIADGTFRQTLSPATDAVLIEGLLNGAARLAARGDADTICARTLDLLHAAVDAADPPRASL